MLSGGRKQRPLFLLFGTEFTALKTKSPQDARLLEIAEPVAVQIGLNIVRIRVMSGKHTTLQIMAEKTDGTVDVADCAHLSRKLSKIFEDDEPFTGPYTLEVSSPGLDRPLTEIVHFERWVGFHVKLELDRMAEGRKRFKGVIAGVEDGNVLLDMEDEEESTLIPFDWIAEAKLVITDALMAAGSKARDEDSEPLEGDE
jgi:ribosome maturation factor RimP